MSLELMKMKAEMLRVQAAKADMEVSVFERRADIERLEKNIEIQENKLMELTEKINNISREK